MNRVASSTHPQTAHVAPAEEIEPGGELPRALVESSLDGLLASPVFRRSDRHRRFMRHIVQASLDGRTDQLKEVLLAIALFDRRIETYDSRTDPIVRVEAGRVREKLARYYATDGSRDLVVFDIPVGSYVPRIVRRAAPGGEESDVYVVMPFATAGAQADTSLAIGLAHQLIGQLGRVKGIKVVARFSTFEAHDRKLGIKAVGRLLNATRVIDGSLQRHANRLRCSARIYRARDGVCLWSHTFDSEADRVDADGIVDEFAFQDRVTAGVLAAATPATAAQAPIVERPSVVATTQQREARDLIERARYLSRRYDAASTDRVVELAERSVALDPDNAQAQVVLATACLYRITLLNAPGHTMLPRVEKALDRALMLDPRDGDAIALRAMIAFRFFFDWPRSQRLFHDALRISAETSSLNYRFAFCLILNGHFEEGLTHARLAIDLDPLNLALRAHTTQLQVFARDYAGGEANARAILELEPGHFYMTYVLATIHLFRGEYDAAIELASALARSHPDYPISRLCRITALGMRGDVEQGRDELSAYLESLGTGYCSPFLLATAQVTLGDRAAAYESLERGVRERDSSICSVPTNPLFAPCHDDPVFLAFLARIGLCPPVPLHTRPRGLDRERLISSD